MASINYEGWYVTEGDNPDVEKQYLKLTGSYSYKNKSDSTASLTIDVTLQIKRDSYGPSYNMGAEGSIEVNFNQSIDSIKQSFTNFNNTIDTGYIDVCKLQKTITYSRLQDLSFNFKASFSTNKNTKLKNLAIPVEDSTGKRATGFTGDRSFTIKKDISKPSAPKVTDIEFNGKSVKSAYILPDSQVTVRIDPPAAAGGQSLSYQFYYQVGNGEKKVWGSPVTTSYRTGYVKASVVPRGQKITFYAQTMGSLGVNSDISTTSVSTTVAKSPRLYSLSYSYSSGLKSYKVSYQNDTNNHKVSANIKLTADDDGTIQFTLRRADVSTNISSLKQNLNGTVREIDNSKDTDVVQKIVIKGTTATVQTLVSNTVKSSFSASLTGSLSIDYHCIDALGQITGTVSITITKNSGIDINSFTVTSLDNSPSCTLTDDEIDKTAFVLKVRCELSSNVKQFTGTLYLRYSSTYDFSSFTTKTITSISSSSGTFSKDINFVSTFQNINFFNKYYQIGVNIKNSAGESTGTYWNRTQYFYSNKVFNFFYFGCSPHLSSISGQGILNNKNAFFDKVTFTPDRFNNMAKCNIMYYIDNMDFSLDRTVGNKNFTIVSLKAFEVSNLNIIESGKTMHFKLNASYNTSNFYKASNEFEANRVYDFYFNNVTYPTQPIEIFKKANSSIEISFTNSMRAIESQFSEIDLKELRINITYNNQSKLIYREIDLSTDTARITININDILEISNINGDIPLGLPFNAISNTNFTLSVIGKVSKNTILCVIPIQLDLRKPIELAPNTFGTITIKPKTNHPEKIYEKDTLTFSFPEIIARTGLNLTYTISMALSQTSQVSNNLPNLSYLTWIGSTQVSYAPNSGNTITYIVPEQYSTNYAYFKLTIEDNINSPLIYYYNNYTSNNSLQLMLALQTSITLNSIRDQDENNYSVSYICNSLNIDSPESCKNDNDKVKIYLEYTEDLSSNFLPVQNNLTDVYAIFNNTTIEEPTKTVAFTRPGDLKTKEILYFRLKIVGYPYRYNGNNPHFQPEKISYSNIATYVNSNTPTIALRYKHIGINTGVFDEDEKDVVLKVNFTNDRNRIQLTGKNGAASMLITGAYIDCGSWS